MGIETEWVVRDHVILVHYMGSVSADDMKHAMDTIVAMIETTNTSVVHTIVDTSTLTEYPNEITVLRNATKQLLVHPRYGWLIVYGNTNPLTMFLIRVATSIFNTQFRTAKDQADALDFLCTVDPDLADTMGRSAQNGG